MWIRLIRKLADQLDGIDVSAHREGDVFEVPRYEAELLIVEEWAIPSDKPQRDPVLSVSMWSPLVFAMDGVQRRTAEQLRRIREALAVKQFEEQDRRRAEDRFRDELRDARAKTITSHSTDDGSRHSEDRAIVKEQSRPNRAGVNGPPRSSTK
jgi:hypothetical protein